MPAVITALRQSLLPGGLLLLLLVLAPEGDLADRKLLEELVRRRSLHLEEELLDVALGGRHLLWYLVEMVVLGTDRGELLLVPDE